MPDNTNMEDMDMTINDCVNSKQKSCFQLHPIIFMILYSLVRLKKEPIRKWKKLISPTNNISVPTVPVNPEKPDVPLNKNDAFQKVQKRRVQEKR